MPCGDTSTRWTRRRDSSKSANLVIDSTSGTAAGPSARDQLSPIGARGPGQASAAFISSDASIGDATAVSKRAAGGRHLLVVIINYYK